MKTTKKQYSYPFSIEVWVNEDSINAVSFDGYGCNSVLKWIMKWMNWIWGYNIIRFHGWGDWINESFGNQSINLDYWLNLLFVLLPVFLVSTVNEQQLVVGVSINTTKRVKRTLPSSRNVKTPHEAKKAGATMRPAAFLCLGRPCRTRRDAFFVNVNVGRHSHETFHLLFISRFDLGFCYGCNAAGCKVDTFRHLGRDRCTALLSP